MGDDAAVPRSPTLRAHVHVGLGDRHGARLPAELEQSSPAAPDHGGRVRGMQLRAVAEHRPDAGLERPAGRTGGWPAVTVEDALAGRGGRAPAGMGSGVTAVEDEPPEPDDAVALTRPGPVWVDTRLPFEGDETGLVVAGRGQVAVRRIEVHVNHHVAVQ